LGDRALRLSAGAAFALLLALASPFRAGELRLDAGWLAGWFVLWPFARMLRGLPPRRAFWWATLSATAGYALVIFWLYVVVTVFGLAPPAAGVGAVLGVAFAFGLHSGLSGLLIAWLAPSGRELRLVAVLPAAWLAGEHLRSFDLFGGFPWAYLGYAVHADPWARELAALGGVWGLGFLLAATATLLALARWRLAVGLVIAAHALGWALARSASEQASGLRAGIVQASISQDVKWTPELLRRHFAAHLELSRRAAERGPLDLIVWPEASVPVSLEGQAEYGDAVRALADETGALVVVGGIGVDWGPGGDDYRIHNSAFAVAPQRGVVDRYDKSHLVPFGEYVPALLRPIATAIAGGVAGIGETTPGDGARVLRTGGTPDPDLAALICYEAIYPGLVRQAARGGASVLLNLTNDAWYGRTSAPHQFLAIAALRSVEHGVPMLRAANTGVSAIVGAGGAVLEETALFEPAVLVADVPARRAGPTPYTRFGDWVVGASWAILVAFGGRRLVGRPQRPGAGDPR
jgi:apolipoprotein N-acyltransferase